MRSYLWERDIGADVELAELVNLLEDGTASKMARHCDRKMSEGMNVWCDQTCKCLQTWLCRDAVERSKAWLKRENKAMIPESS